MDKILKCSGIYCIKNTINNKVYVGQTINLNKRKNEHFSQLENNKHKNKHLQNAYNKYGKNNFEFCVLIYCESFESTRYEKFFDDYYKNLNLSYNIRECTDSNIGIKFSEESKKKMSENHWDSSGINNPFYGKKFSEVHKQKLSESKKGKYLGEKSPSFGRHVSKETKEKQSKAHFGKKRYNSSSQYLGIGRVAQKYKNNIYISWKAFITINKKGIYIGQFKDEIIAAKAYDRYVIENNLPNPLNFPERI